MIESLISRILQGVLDPFYLICTLALCYVLILSYLQERNEKQILDKFKDKKGTIFLPIVKVHFQASSRIPIGYQWFSASLLITSESIFLFGKHHMQFYSKLKVPPSRCIWLEKCFVPFDEIKLNGEDLVMRYTSLHWHKATCKLTLKNLRSMDEFEQIQKVIIQDLNWS